MKDQNMVKIYGQPRKQNQPGRLHGNLPPANFVLLHASGSHASFDSSLPGQVIIFPEGMMEKQDGQTWEARWLGMVAYDEAWQLQEQLVAEVAAGRQPPTILLLEHPHIFTLGRRGQAENVLWDEAERSRRGVDIRYVDRGGDVTYHGPGQLVCYPLLPLAPKDWAAAGEEHPRIPQADYVGYVRSLERVIIFALARLGIAGGQRPGLTGVWVAADVWARCPRCDPRVKPQPAKIASIGVKVDVRGISRHGFALNVNTDPAYWEGIIPCGLDQVQMANIADLLKPAPDMAQVCEVVLDAFEDVFHCHLRRPGHDNP